MKDALLAWRARRYTEEMLAWIAAITVCTPLVGVALSLLIRRHPAWRLQSRLPTERQFGERVRVGAINTLLLLTFIGPGLALAPQLFSWRWLGLGAFTLQLLAALVVDDTFFYFVHRAQHRNKRFYRIHARHHQAFAPLPIDFIFVHPLELAMGSAMSGLAVAAVFVAAGQANAYVFIAFTAIRNAHQLLIHSGVRIPGACAHDYHHANNADNYASMFPFCDRLLGTWR